MLKHYYYPETDKKRNISTGNNPSNIDKVRSVIFYSDFFISYTKNT